jgi:hypothetical protein
LKIVEGIPIAMNFAGEEADTNCDQGMLDACCKGGKCCQHAWVGHKEIGNWKVPDVSNFDFFLPLPLRTNPLWGVEKIVPDSSPGV